MCDGTCNCNKYSCIDIVEGWRENLKTRKSNVLHKCTRGKGESQFICIYDYYTHSFNKNILKKKKKAKNKKKKHRYINKQKLHLVYNPEIKKKDENLKHTFQLQHNQIVGVEQQTGGSCLNIY